MDTAEYKMKKEALKNIMKDAMKKKIKPEPKSPNPDLRPPVGTKWASNDDEGDSLVIRIKGMRRNA